MLTNTNYQNYAPNYFSLSVNFRNAFNSPGARNQCLRDFTSCEDEDFNSMQYGQGDMWAGISIDEVSTSTCNVSQCAKTDEQNYLFLEDLYGGGDKDFNDIVMRTKGLISEGKGEFSISQSGQVNVDYLQDGGAYSGEVAVFSLKGMENLDRNSLEFKKEAMRRAKSNSKDGGVVLSDVTSDGKLDGGNGSSSLSLNPGDRVGLIFLGNSSFNNISADGCNWPNEVYFSTGSSDNLDHFKISKNPENLSANNDEAKQQLVTSLASAQGVLA